ncbi:hypothetical protein EIP75_22140, partial [Aquabacterium soli]
MNAILFTDIDDVLVLRRTVDFDKHRPQMDDDMCSRLVHPPAIQVLSELIEQGARVVITSNWTRFMNQEGFERLLAVGNFPREISPLHPAWAAPPQPGGTRLEAVDAWLREHHHGEPYAILDDTDSGSGLHRSAHDIDGRVVLCEPGIGLHPGHLRLKRPPDS